MKRYKAVIQQEVTELTCDTCGLKTHVNEGYEFSEFISVEHKCGYGAIHGDGKQISIDLCQQCFADMCGNTLKIEDLIENQPLESSSEYALEYNNIIQAISKSKNESRALKKTSDIRIIARDILSAEKISNQEELQVALKRVEQLWDAQYHSAEGNELHQLADLICAYEKKDWNSYFEEGPLVDDDFMPDRLNFKSKLTCDEEQTAKGMLSSIPINTNIDEVSSRDSVLTDNNLDDAKQQLLESITDAQAKYPELRLGQLLIYALKIQQPCQELFDIGDDGLTEKLSNFSL